MAGAASPTEGLHRRYQRIKLLGEGQFGVVHLAEDKETKQQVAIKRIRLGKLSDARDGIHRTAIREIKILQEVHHANIIQLMEVFQQGSNINLVFELAKTDLEKVIQDRSIVLGAGDVKSFLLMTLQGLEFLHDRWILHRDMKPNNLLLTAKGVVKVTDFGLATFFGSPNRQYTSDVATIWYRGPELLYGAKSYGTGVDMWSVGCIQAELELRTPLFPGESDRPITQLTKIFSALGTCTSDEWPDMESLPNYLRFEPMPRTPFNRILTAASDDALDLISYLLVCNPAKRFTATQALQHPYFTNEPAPTAPEALPLPADKPAPGAGAAAARAHEPRFAKRKLLSGGGDGNDDEDPPIRGKHLKFE